MSIHVRLEVSTGPEAGRTFEFDRPDSFLVGRSRKAHLRLGSEADPYVSRAHFLLDIRPPRVLMTDLGSKNGTLVNEERTAHAELADGDEIRVGKTRLKISIQEMNEREAIRVLCVICGKDVTDELGALPSEQREFIVYTCRACQARAGAEKRREGPGAEPPAERACAKCGRDLTIPACSDGRDAELENPLYLCRDCAGREQGLGLDFDRMGEYRILNVLGQGGMGIVYRAVHEPTRRVVALKRILTEFVRSERACKLFEREINVQSKVIHPNLVRFLDIGRAGITPFFATEYLTGGDLGGLVTHLFKGPVPPKSACRITVQILRGLEALHQRGFVHRDLKPANFLLSRPLSEGGYRVKICDYGLAKSFEDAGNSLFNYTRTGSFAGTYMFMPPEQILEYKFVRPTADVYAVGVTLYYLLCARYTVDYPTPLDALVQALRNEKKQKNALEMILEDRPVPLMKRNPALPKALCAVADKAVKKEVEKRYQGAAEFREALEGALP